MKKILSIIALLLLATPVWAQSLPTPNVAGLKVNGNSQTFPISGNLVGTTDTQTFTNKTISGASNTLSSIANASLTNSATTVNGQTCTLGSTCTVTGGPTGSAGGDLSGTYPNPTVAKINGVALSGLATGILKNTTTTGVPSIAIATDFPILNQNTTGSAATLTTARTLAGNSFNGSANVPFVNKFLVQGTADAGLTGAQFMGALATGILKNTTTTGVQSIATGADLPVMTATVGGAVPTPPNNTTTFLRGDGTFATPAGSGGLTVGTTTITSGTNTYLEYNNSGVLGESSITGPIATPSNSEKQITVASAPTYTFPENLSTEFAGDFSHTNIPLLYTVNGAATLGQPTTGFQWNPAVTPYQTYLINNSGWNNSTSSNAGRTGVAPFRTMISQNGQGDAVAYVGFCQVNSTLSGATTWLASPACEMMGGNLGSSVDGAYLEGIGDLDFTDNGHDIAAIGNFYGFTRTNNTAALGETWLGSVMTSNGTKNADAGNSVNGPWTVGFDTSTMTGGNAALNMATGQRVVFNSTSSSLGGTQLWGNVQGNTYESYDGTNLNFVSGGVTALELSSSTLTVPLANVQINSASAFSPQVFVLNQTNDANGGYFQTRKSRGVSPTAVQVGDTLGTFLFQGYNTTPSLSNGAYLTAVVESVGAGAMSAKFQLAAGSKLWEFQSAGRLVIPTNALGSAVAGGLEYDGTAFYESSAASSRQVADTEQVTVLSADNSTPTNVSTAQNVFPTGQGTLTVQAATTYEFEAEYEIDTTGATSNTLQTLFGGTATFTGITYTSISTNGTASTTPATASMRLSNSAAASAVTAAVAAATQRQVVLRGTMRINAAGTVIPQFQYSAAPGAAPVVKVNSYFRAWPVGSNTVTQVGNWS